MKIEEIHYAQIVNVIKTYYNNNVIAVFIYGSYAKGKNNL